MAKCKTLIFTKSDLKTCITADNAISKFEVHVDSWSNFIALGSHLQGIDNYN